MGGVGGGCLIIFDEVDEFFWILLFGEPECDYDCKKHCF